MAALFRAPQPRCMEPGCRRHGTYVVRSTLMQPSDDVDRAPRCLRHAGMLAAWYEARERLALAESPAGEEDD
jgi:hypothetical protein